jgi:hypothetical protein
MQQGWFHVIVSIGLTSLICVYSVHCGDEAASCSVTIAMLTGLNTGLRSVRLPTHSVSELHSECLRMLVSRQDEDELEAKFTTRRLFLSDHCALLQRREASCAPVPAVDVPNEV